MDAQEQDNPGMDKVAKLIDDIKFAMFTTHDLEGNLHSRPMTTLQIDSDGNLWFFTGEHSAKVHELNDESRVNVIYARIDKQDYLSVLGSAEVVRDRVKMQELWTPWIKPWFPDGLDDPELVLLKVKIISADYWDAPGSSVKRLYGLMKGMLTGKTDAMGEQGQLWNSH